MPMMRMAEASMPSTELFAGESEIISEVFLGFEIKMKKKLISVFVVFLLFSCEKSDENYTLCDSENSLCKYFEIKYDNIAKITEDNAELSVTDINTIIISVNRI